MGLVRVTVVPNEAEAELVCSLLRAAGIRCMQRQTDVAAGGGEGLPMFSGPREILVDEHDGEAARKLINSS
jgi:hypothetical protein